MSDFEVNESGTIRKLNLTQMALTLALRIIDAMDPDAAESDLEDLTLLRFELGLQASE